MMDSTKSAIRTVRWVAKVGKLRHSPLGEEAQRLNYTALKCIQRSKVGRRWRIPIQSRGPGRDTIWNSSRVYGGKNKLLLQFLYMKKRRKMEKLIINTLSEHSYLQEPPV
jgi:hypothetical protein